LEVTQKIGLHQRHDTEKYEVVMREKTTVEIVMWTYKCFGHLGNSTKGASLKSDEGGGGRGLRPILSDSTAGAESLFPHASLGAADGEEGNKSPTRMSPTVCMLSM
jgi:hypothetical protein